MVGLKIKMSDIKHSEKTIHYNLEKRFDSGNIKYTVGNLYLFKEDWETDFLVVQKSGYFSRSAPANAKDLALIRECAVVAVQSALAGISGLVGQDEDQANAIRACEFERVAGAKPFNTEQTWFAELLSEINQPKGLAVKH
jgi:hypothetical protein